MKSMTLNPQGWINEAQHVLSPNQDDRPDGILIDMIVIHNISLPPNEYGGDGIIALFTNTLDPMAHPYYAKIYQQKVSAHFLIRRDGSLIQFVSCLQRAWHAGISSWCGRERCNDFSVGIELEGSDFEAFEPIQYETLRLLIATLQETFAIAHIVGHSDIAPDRKTDPGPFFDWNILHLTANR